MQEITVEDVTEEDFDLILEILQTLTINITDYEKLKQYNKLYLKIQNIVHMIKSQ
jgi:hypothetical protein